MKTESSAQEAEISGQENDRGRAGQPDLGRLADLRRRTPTGGQGGAGEQLGQNGGESAGSREKGKR